MPLDTSSATALINQLSNPPNPLEGYGKTVGIANALMQFRADKALQDIYGQSIDPQTGQVDLGKFNALAQSNPAALWHFGDSMRQSGVGVGAQGHGTSAQVQAQLDQLAVQQAYLSPLLPKAQAGTLTADELQEALKDIPPGVISPTTMANVQRQIANGANPSHMVIGGYFASQEARNQGAMAQPSAGMVTSGSQQYPTQGNIFYPGSPGHPGGFQYPSAPMPQATPPGVTEIDIGGGQIRQVPNDLLPGIMHNNPTYKLVSPPPTGGGTTTAPSGGAPGSGHYPGLPPGAGAPQPPPAGQPTPAVPSYAQPPGPLPPEAGGVGLKPSPGYVTNTVDPSQKQATALATSAADTPNIRGLIEDMRSQVNAPGWNPGLGAQAGSTFRQVLDRLQINAQPGSSPDAQRNAQAAYDEFVKDAKMIEARQLQALGTNPTDARQGLAEGITPGLAQSKEGVLGISSTLMGNQDAINRTNAAWNEAKANGWSDARHKEWLNKNWNVTDKETGGRFDPRVFWMANTPVDKDGNQWTRFGQKIPDAQQAQFEKNVNYAKKQGWIKQAPDGTYSVASP